jgi:hypothetical protein
VGCADAVGDGEKGCEGDMLRCVRPLWRSNPSGAIARRAELVPELPGDLDCEDDVADCPDCLGEAVHDVAELLLMLALTHAATHYKTAFDVEGCPPGCALLHPICAISGCHRCDDH